MVRSSYFFLILGTWIGMSCQETSIQRQLQLFVVMFRTVIAILCSSHHLQTIVNMMYCCTEQNCKIILQIVYATTTKIRLFRHDYFEMQITVCMDLARDYASESRHTAQNVLFTRNFQRSVSSFGQGLSR